MNPAMIGGGGGSVVVILIGLAVVAVLALILFAGGIALAIHKRPVLSAPLFVISLALASWLGSLYLEYDRWAGIQRLRKKDFDVVVKILPKGSYLVTVDGLPDSRELILLDGRINFQIDFPDSKNLVGKCSNFQFRARDGGFGSIELGRIDISATNRAALMSGMPSVPEGKLYDAQTEEYTIWFRQQAPDFEWFTCARTIKPP